MLNNEFDENILILSTEYYSFVKDQTETIAPFFPAVNVLVRHNPLAEISSIIPFSSLVNFRKAYLIRDTDLPPNVSVTPTPICYVPIDYYYRRLGELHSRAARNAIRRNDLDFDLIHAHATWSAGFAGAKLKERHNVPLVVTAHGYDIYSLPFKDPAWQREIEYVLNSADAVITVSKRNLECIRRLDVDTQTYVIPNGFRKDLFHPKETSECRKILGLPQDKTILLTVGNLDPVKGQKYLIDALVAIAGTREDIFCVIVGMGGEKKALESQIRSSGLSDAVLLAGGKRHEEIPIWMNSCDIFILPSLDEGNPTVMFEALACGKPFVGTRVGGVPEVIASEMYGLLAEPGDARDLEEKILLALERKWDRARILEYAMQFTWENIGNDLLNVYRRTLGGSN